MSRRSDFELDDYTAEELLAAEELDKMVDQIEGVDVESRLAIDMESAKRLSEMREILTRIKRSYDLLLEGVEPPEEGRERIRTRIREEMERRGMRRRSLWERMGEGIRRALSTQPSPQPAYRREEISDLRIHGQEMLKDAFILKARVGDQRIEKVIREGEYLIGSSPEADIRIADPDRYISRRHAKLILREGEIFVVDLDSTNGTFVNGRRIEPGEEVRVNPDDRVELADIPLEIDRL